MPTLFPYTTLFRSLLPGSPAPALFAIAAVMLLLLFLGIRNAWDQVTWVAVGGIEQLGERTGTD